MSKVAIIGGGLSGLFCAILIKKNNPSIDVCVLERLERVGKKILSTGNGKCNFSNTNVTPLKYNEPQFVSQIFSKISKETLYHQLSELGLFFKEDNEGRMYPYSESANSFLDVLRNNIKKYNIEEKCNFEVTKINYENNKFIIENTRRQNIEADCIVIATGGKSYPVLGSNGSGYNLLKPWKIKITRTLPGLVGIKVNLDEIKGLSGLRFKGLVSLIDKKTNQKLHEEYGEIQFKDDGISGIVIMNIASKISRNILSKHNNNYTISIDLLDKYTVDELVDLLIYRKSLFKDFEAIELINGMFPKNLCILLLKKAKIDLSNHVNNISNKDIYVLSTIIKSLHLTYKGMYDFDRSQVTVGGIDLDEINVNNLSLNKMPKIFICGEVMNIDGDCGGYNMHYALCSGYIVSKNIIKEI